MADHPDLRLVRDPDEDPEVCVACGKQATTTAAVDASPLCLECFTETHWHPSWQKAFAPEEGTQPDES